MIDDVGRLYSFGPQLVALLGQRSRRTGLEGKMIEARRYAEPAVDACIVFCRHVRNALWFQKGDELIAPDIEKEVSKASAFFDLYRVGDDRFETQNTLVELTSLVQVKGRETDMGKPSMPHGYYSAS